MKKKKTYKPKSKSAVVNEPSIDYQNNLSITTLEELSEMDREATRNMNHEQRLEYLQQLNYNLYGSDLSKQEEELSKGQLKIRKQE